MQSYFGPISGDENITFLDQPVVDQEISRSLDASVALPRISITDSTPSLTTFRRHSSVQHVELFGDEDVFMCGKCKHQFYDLHMFLQHKKEGCMVNIAIPEQQPNCLPAIQLPQFQSARQAPELHSQSILLPSLSGDVSGARPINAAQTFDNRIEVTGLNLTQGLEKDRPVPSNPVRVAAQTSGIPVCGNASASAPSPNSSVNMNDVNPLVQLQNPCGLLQGGVPLGSRRVESIMIGDDIMTNSSSRSPVFNTESQMDRCFQENDVSPQQLSNLVNVLGGSGISPLLQSTPPAHTTYQQPISSFNNTQQVYIHIQQPQQFETQTTYSILPKNPSMNYAVGLNLSSLQVAPLPMNTEPTTNLCSTPEGFFQPQTISVQDISKESNVQNNRDYAAQAATEMEVSECIQNSSPIITAKKKVVTKKVFTCQYCDKSFGKTFDLQQHLRSHTGEKPFQCPACGRAFAQKSNVKKHMEIHKVWPKEAMDIMPIMVVHSNHIPGTNKRKVGEGSGVLAHPKFPTATRLCPYCNIPLGSYNERKAHMLNHKDKQVYKCVKDDCGQTFDDRDNFVEHAKTHFGSMKYNCHHCREVFDTLLDIRKHQEQLDDETNSRHAVKYRCKLCPAKFARAELLQKHMIVETHKHFCTVCSKQFSCTSYLDHHMKKMHASTPRKKYKCELCGKFMNSVYYLQSHMLIHTKENPFKCQICDARFNRKDKLRRHMVTHDPNKKYKCPFRETMGCMKEFNRPDKLKAHIISHNGIKAHQCSYCSKRFSRRNIKLAHEKRHSVKYSCDTCGKSFRNQPTLDTHKCIPSKGKQKQASNVEDDKHAEKMSTAIHNDLLNLREPEGPMYAYRSGSKRKHLRRNASRPSKAVSKKADAMKSNVEINITAAVTAEETEVDIEGDA